MSPAKTLTTDHSKATADASHTHGTGPGFAIPAKSRAERPTSFVPADFPMPTGREEEWRFTPLARLGTALDDVPVENTPQWTLEKLPAGVTVTQIETDDARARSVRPASDRAGAVASARAPRGILMAIAPGTVVPRPVELAIAFDGAPIRTHFVLEVGDGAEATVIAQYSGAAEVSEFLSINLAPRARLNLVLIDECASEAIHLTDLVVRIGNDAHLRGSLVTLGSGLARTNASVEMAGEGSEVDLYGLYFADSGQHIENRVFIDHVAPNARSRVAYKGALAGQTARTVWIGDVLIRAAASGTDTYELNRNLLLTDGARADSVPNLEIETGEIAGAGHASATGRFDDEQMFYLQSRGIPEDQARRMVVRGFFADLVGQIGVAHVEEGLMRAIDRELGVAHDEKIACRASDLAPGNALRADLKRDDGVVHAFAIVRSEDGDVYAIDDTCSHAEVSLSEGDIDGCEIECWAHGSRFDLRTGEPHALPAMTPVNTYPVRIDGDDIVVDVDAPRLSTKENA